MFMRLGARHSEEHCHKGSEKGFTARHFHMHRLFHLPLHKPPFIKGQSDIDTKGVFCDKFLGR